MADPPRLVGVTTGAAVKMAVASGVVGFVSGFIAGFKTGESIYADEKERRRVQKTAELCVAVSGTTLLVLGLIRLVT